MKEISAKHEGEEPEAPEFEIRVSRHFAAWLAEQRTSLAFTLPPLKLFLIGLQPDGQLSVFERSFSKCMGVYAAGDALYFSTRHQIWRMENALEPGQLYDGSYDRLYIPRVAYTTGKVGTHDVGVDAQGRIIFVNTLFGCLATVSESYSFRPLWWPRFLDGPAPGDRCHLNGLAMRDGRPAYATSVSATSAVDSWREQRRGGGVVSEVDSKEIVVAGLSMPHSPRWHDGRLWLTNSGTGELGVADLERGRFEPLTFAPGFLRGLTFSGHYAIVGSSRPRYGGIYAGLDLDERLREHKQQPRLGLFVIDLRSGEIVHWLFIEGQVRELYDVVVLPGVRQPMALGLISDEIERVIHHAPFVPLPAAGSTQP